MTDQQISAFINILRFANQITPLQKDILDTWDALQKKPFDEETAHMQIVSNNVNHPELLAAISAMPPPPKMEASTVATMMSISALN